MIETGTKVIANNLMKIGRTPWSCGLIRHDCKSRSSPPKSFSIQINKNLLAELILSELNFSIFPLNKWCNAEMHYKLVTSVRFRSWQSDLQTNISQRNVHKKIKYFDVLYLMSELILI